MYYAYTTVLGKSEKEFWEATPKKFFKQLQIHQEINTQKKKKNPSNEVAGEVTRLKVIG